MPELTIFKGNDGKLTGWGEKGRRAYAKWRKIIAELGEGEMVRFTYNLPRSPRHHRFFFARLGELFELQEQFEDVNHMLEWLKVGAGHVDFVPGLDGHLVALPRSIAWHNCEEQDFIEFTRAMNDFLWTPHAQAYLWPELTDQQRAAMFGAWYHAREEQRSYTRVLPQKVAA